MANESVATLAQQVLDQLVEMEQDPRMKKIMQEIAGECQEFKARLQRMANTEETEETEGNAELSEEALRVILILLRENHVKIVEVEKHEKPLDVAILEIIKTGGDLSEIKARYDSLSPQDRQNILARCQKMALELKEQEDALIDFNYPIRSDSPISTAEANLLIHLMETEVEPAKYLTRSLLKVGPQIQTLQEIINYFEANLGKSKTE